MTERTAKARANAKATAGPSTSLRMTTKGEKQIPFGNDRKNGKGKSRSFD